MSAGIYTLFDIPTKPPRTCWSMNTWRTRLLLNAKGLEYETEWLEYPEIRTRLQGYVDPSEDGTYTVPVIQTPDGTYISDSYKIAAYIEEKYPSPPNMHLNHPIQDRFRKSMISFMTALQPIYMLGVPQNILADASIDFFRTTRHKDLGMSLEEFFTKESPGAFERAEPHLHNITALLKEDTSGPFFLGQMVSYTDFIWAADLLFWKKFGEKEFQEILRRGGDTEVHATFLDGLNKWTARND